MTSAQVVETSVTNNSSFQNYSHPDDHTRRTTDTPGFKPFTMLRSLGRQSERLANNYISYVSIVRRIRQQLWFNHRCKDLGLVPAGLKLKSPLNTQEAIQIVKSTCRRLVKARINDCHRRLNHYNSKLQQRFDKLKQLLPTNLLDIVTTIADRRADKTRNRVRTEQQRKLTKLQQNKDKKRQKTDDNWVRNISSRPLDKTETQVLSYGLKHSVTPKRIPTETIVSSVEAVLSRQRDLSEPAKDDIRSRIASTIQSASIPNSNLTRDEQQALKRLKNDDNIVILPADKGRVTVVMDKTDYFNKMDALVNDKQTYEELKRDPTPTLQRKLNNKLLTLKKTDAIDVQRYYRLRCSVPQQPKLYGLPKLHKPGIPMRPIVSFCGSPTYQLSKYLTTILQPLTDESRRKLQSTENFIDAIKTVQLPNDYKLVSFDVKSLFTSIPLQLALQCTETAIQQSTVELPLPTEDIMDLLNLCLTSTYFQYNGKHYKQLHGTAMGSPVSVVVAEIVMQNIEERALATCRQTIPLWLRYVDDTFTAVHKDEIDAFHDHLNEQNADIQFTREIEENGKLPFLDCLVSRDNNELRTTVYRKPTHTDRLLDETSYNPTSHKATTIKTLTRRARLVCDTPESLSDESRYLERVFHKNNYCTDFIRRNTHRLESNGTETDETNRNPTPVTTATIPYIKGTSETIARILQPYNIRVAHKPITTLRHLLTNVKDRDEPNNRQGAVYKIKCSDCQATYIGETGRNLNTRLTEHKRATRKGDVTNNMNIAEHHQLQSRTQSQRSPQSGVGRPLKLWRNGKNRIFLIGCSYNNKHSQPLRVLRGNFKLLGNGSSFGRTKLSLLTGEEKIGSSSQILQQRLKERRHRSSFDYHLSDLITI